MSEARLSLSVPSPISFSRRADMRSKSACDPEYLWCAAVRYCPATNAESASDESSSSVPEAYSEPPCCRRSRRPSGKAWPLGRWWPRALADEPVAEAAVAEAAFAMQGFVRGQLGY